MKEQISRKSKRTPEEDSIKIALAMCPLNIKIELSVNFRQEGLRQTHAVAGTCCAVPQH
jgi:hypothetical protein